MALLSLSSKETIKTPSTIPGGTPRRYATIPPPKSLTSAIVAKIGMIKPVIASRSARPTFLPRTCRAIGRFSTLPFTHHLIEDCSSFAPEEVRQSLLSDRCNQSANPFSKHPVGLAIDGTFPRSRAFSDLIERLPGRLLHSWCIFSLTSTGSMPQIDLQAETFPQWFPLLRL